MPPDLQAVTDALASQLDDRRPGWQASSGFLVWHLADDDGLPVWTLDVGAEGIAEQYLFEARTATPLRPVAPGAPAQPLARLRVEASGNDNVTASLGDIIRTYSGPSFKLEGHHRELAARVHLTGPLPGELDASLVAPNATAIPLVGGEIRVAWPATGDWRLRVAVEGGAPLQEFHYWLCAPGEDAEQACAD